MELQYLLVSITLNFNTAALVSCTANALLIDRYYDLSGTTATPTTARIATNRTEDLRTAHVATAARCPF